MDGPLTANSGHQGTAMALAPLAHVLYSRVMRYNPADLNWVDRDRFILSAGHASILQYAMLHLSGTSLSADDLRAFRQWGSATPGHPEAGHTPGVEVTTGPLGQGFANAVGMAISERLLREQFGAGAIDHHTWVIAGDGCLMEGVSHEAASLAGHLGLDRLVCVFDDNRITIDGDTDLAASDDVSARFRAYGWHVAELGEIGEDLDALQSALEIARTPNGKPRLLVLRTHIGFPSPDHTDSHAAHGLAFSAEDVSRTKAVMGIPDEPFHLPADLIESYREVTASVGAYAFSEWEASSHDARQRSDWDACFGVTPPNLADVLPSWDLGSKVATRKAFQAALDATAEFLPGLVSGSADLTGNTGTKVASFSEQSAQNLDGRQMYYGIREHGMGSAMVGMALHGGVLPVGGTFFVFVDYMRPPVRLAALSGARVVFVFTHDSVAVGEDGPTHQPIEQLAGLRAMPNLHVLRPADANETSRAWVDAVTHDGPTAMILSRQDVRVMTDGSAIAVGAAVVGYDAGDPDVILIGTGSEVSLCLDAADAIRASGRSVRVVSMPSCDRFRSQTVAVRNSILTPGVPTVSVEAGSTFGWHEWSDRQVGIDRFGASAPGDVALDRLGINIDAIVVTVNEMLGGGA